MEHIREYCEQLYANRLDNLNIIDKFLERHWKQKLTQKEIENLNISIRSKEIGNSKTFQKKYPDSDGFTGKL